MAIPEPNNALYAAVKAIADPWPPDDEDVAHQLADAWNKTGQAAAQAGGQAANSQQAVASSWLDQAGEALGIGLNGVAESMQQIGQAATGLARKADTYAQVLTDVKNAITQVVDEALPAYLQAGSPALRNGPALQQQIVTKVANELTALVESAAGRLGGGRNKEKMDNLDKASHILGAISAAAGLVALVPFPPLEAAATGVAVLAGVGQLTVDTVKAATDENPDDKAKNWDAVGADALGVVPGGKTLRELADIKDAAEFTKLGEAPSKLAVGGAVTTAAGAGLAFVPSQDNTSTLGINAGTALSLGDVAEKLKAKP